MQAYGLGRFLRSYSESHEAAYISATSSMDSLRWQEGCFFGGGHFFWGGGRAKVLFSVDGGQQYFLGLENILCWGWVKFYSRGRSEQFSRL